MEFDINDYTNEELEELRKENTKYIENATDEEIDEWLETFEIKFIGFSDQEQAEYLNNELQMEGLLHLCFGLGWDEIEIENDSNESQLVVFH